MDDVPVAPVPTFKQELCSLLNKHSIDAKLETADYILAAFVENMLVDLDHCLKARQRHGVMPK